MRGKRQGKRQFKREFSKELWQPRTIIGKEVKEGKITGISQVLRSGKPFKEPEVVDALMPNMDEEILDVGLVQRMHESGRRIKYRVVSVVGNRDGIVGVGHGSARDIGSSIRKSTTIAKLNLIEVARGCGSWECGCGRSHSIPFDVTGKSGSVKVSIKPAPRGLGIASAKVPRTILKMAGVQDAWTRSEGETRTTLNFSLAALDALKQTTKMALSEKYKEHVTIGKADETSG